MADDEVIITSERSKLPPEVAALLDPASPLPAGTLYFEKSYTIDDMIRRLLIAIGIGLLALIVIPFGVAMVLDRHEMASRSGVDFMPLGFGAVCALASVMMFASVRSCWELRQKQLSGQCTRRGIFLTPAGFVEAGESSTMLVPRSRFVGINGSGVKYQHNGTEKTTSLPKKLVNGTPEELQSAIARWAGDRTPPPLGSNA